MRRREAIAGLAGAGVLGAGGYVAARGVPSLGDDAERVDPIELETIDAPGSEAGTVRVPADDRPTFVDFFGTWCPPCVEQMPALGAVHDRVGDEVLFLSATTEGVGHAITREELADWWAENDGDWTVALDLSAELAARCDLQGWPWAAAIDADGYLRWTDRGIKTEEELVAGIDRARE